ncbi:MULTISPECIES: FAD-dependent monooxygenase [Streptomyces]|uniref:FAD-dependent monooxygenase n=1 Tax=Streptomyces koelreuteriae TaxID=2838015 RepID=A0ABX8G1D6_9ACTN|nr:MULTISPECIES: FAD-dependent monooxygenase [Streptomyces]QWB27179.1 FAD-dependent monooxygenase [Streptomyces koelreuteriae]UUA10261.1 FAD-dependent monooxygenase [Streptomyces koelreuteriae]UUA17867.1 FAD-dependent monooxygenase [Streptomyces sp. CRCS-T-1]
MKKPEVLIVGAGIAGPALAYWLSRNGFRPTVVEHARQLRSGGSAIVVKGPAIPVAERMGILPQLRELATRNRSLTLLDPGGRRILQLPLTSDKAPTVEVTRSDLSELLHRSAQTEAEFLFDDTVTALDQDEGGVDVTFRRSAPRRFDLVIGADGMHSTVRRLVFGPERQFASDLGLYGATVPLEPDAIEDPSEMTMLTVPNRMLVVHPSRTTPLAIFTFRAAQPAPHDRKNIALHKQTVADAYADVRWRAPELVAAFLDHPAPFFDPLTTIRVPSWSRGRVVLLGDAAATALLGDGSSMAMTGAYALAEELAAHPGDHARAFAAYESRLRREVGPRQRRVGLLSRLMVPRTRPGLAVRNAVGRAVGRKNRIASREAANR